MLAAPPIITHTTTSNHIGIQHHGLIKFLSTNKNPVLNLQSALIKGLLIDKSKICKNFMRIHKNGKRIEMVGIPYCENKMLSVKRWDYFNATLLKQLEGLLDSNQLFNTCTPLSSQKCSEIFNFLLKSILAGDIKSKVIHHGHLEYLNEGTYFKDDLNDFIDNFIRLKVQLRKFYTSLYFLNDDDIQHMVDYLDAFDLFNLDNFIPYQSPCCLEQSIALVGLLKNQIKKNQQVLNFNFLNHFILNNTVQAQELVVKSSERIISVAIKKSLKVQGVFFYDYEDIEKNDKTGEFLKNLKFIVHSILDVNIMLFMKSKSLNVTVVPISKEDNELQKELVCGKPNYIGRTCQNDDELDSMAIHHDILGGYEYQRLMLLSAGSYMID
ncbi:hypothetical protein BN7_3586 [Wickerhamomyces ciferrii]|uniref:Uncharacterized protein n=1 Tax=Wickerhamomyces ciferrii (strain ATCC 14091 / BCRC 22168 / CBS 111 / JCM 3599 / NBRC 0793 / NRRL Y-1031 F-60-10) TaxID=1206466 RepID=K0KRS4_WICCF|nr:uncharacterized protein BN7_3586 [Wickerhamomyces ciferrii]CCH44029.1 hypothetical protein BN7_3586 [Wickerhamomyces ciferrii]